MAFGWGVLAAELAKAGNKVLDHTLKPAVEKMKDIRFANFKGWTKWKGKSDDAQEARKRRAAKLKRP